jgi:hypothetical protein
MPSLIQQLPENKLTYKRTGLLKKYSQLALITSQKLKGLVNHRDLPALYCFLHAVKNLCSKIAQILTL